MAESKDGMPPELLQKLACPLCLDTLKDATLLGCGHTFCRRCLRRYDLTHRHLDHMVCPLCRGITKWEANRVDDLASNIAVNNYIEGLQRKYGRAARLRRRLTCTTCKVQVQASHFCKNCKIFMCEKCTICHQSMSEMFAGHEVQCLQEIITDLKFTCPPEEELEEKMQAKMDDLIKMCTAKIAKLKESRNDAEVEKERKEIRAAMDKLQKEIKEAYAANARQLEENQKQLVAEINALELNFNGDVRPSESEHQAQENGASVDRE